MKIDQGKPLEQSRDFGDQKKQLSIFCGVTIHRQQPPTTDNNTQPQPITPNRSPTTVNRLPTTANKHDFG